MSFGFEIEKKSKKYGEGLIRTRKKKAFRSAGPKTGIKFSDSTANGP